MLNDQIVHVVNRTTEPLDLTYDGRPYVVPPGYTETGDADKKGKRAVVGAGKNGDPLALPMLAQVAKAGLLQHPIAGTHDPYSPHPTVFYLGIAEEQGVFPIDHVDFSDVEELLDRSLLPADRQTVEHRSNQMRRLAPQKRRRDPKTKQIIGAEPRSRMRFTTEPMDALNENALVGGVQN